MLAPFEWEESVGDLLNLHSAIDHAVRTHKDVDAAVMLHYSDHWRKSIVLPGVNVGAPISQSGYVIDLVRWLRSTAWRHG